MRAVNKAAKKVLETLTSGLPEFGSRKIDHEPAYMAACVEHIGSCDLGPIFSVAHYFVQNGDMMRDPDVTFLRATTTGDFYPLSYRQDALGIDRQDVEITDGKITGVRVRSQKDCAMFCGQWMVNIARQQGLWATRKERDELECAG